MAGETGPTAEIANKISQELFKWFKWERIGLKDQNFDCIKQPKHAPNKKAQHTHPVDIVFKYEDPYLDHSVLLNTDLKSYSKTSIQPSNIRSALKSLAQTINCARASQEWKDRYDPLENSEIRGMLFVYNHDNDYDRDFVNHIEADKRKAKPKEDLSEDEDSNLVNLASLPIEPKQLLHIIEPRTIAYLTTIISDVQRLHSEGSFPVKNYYFFYPELRLHRTRLDQYKRPATIELLCGPFFIVGHDEVKKHDEEKNATVSTFDSGHVIFYNRPGSSHEEFMYLFDILSSYQLLDGDTSLRIRVAHHSPDLDIRSKFNKAIELYIADWGADEYKKQRLQSIDFTIIEIQKTAFSKTELGWDKEKRK